MSQLIKKILALPLLWTQQSPLSETYGIILLPWWEREAWRESNNTIYIPFPPFVRPHLLHQSNNAELTFLSVKNGVTRWVRYSFKRCLGPSKTGEHVAYIPAVRPTLAGFFSPSQSRCHCSCLKHKQLATVWEACSDRSDTISLGFLHTAHVLATNKMCL